MRRLSGVLFTVVLLAASTSTLPAQQSVYMLVDSIRGDQPAPHDREFKLNSVAFASTNTYSTSTTTTGLSAGKAAFSPVKVSMRFHAVSFPSFNKHLAAGTRLPSIEIRHYNSSNKVFYKTVYETVYLTNVATEAADEAFQQIEFVYSKVKWFAPPDPAGLMAPQQIACWDISQNRVC